LAFNEVGRNRDEHEDPIGDWIEERTRGALRFFLPGEPAVHEIRQSRDRDEGDAIPRFRHEDECERQDNPRQRHRIWKIEQSATTHASEKYDRVRVLASARKRV